MREDHNSRARFTTMFDFYALPGDFPGYEDAGQEGDPYVRVRLLEDALGEDISDQRFVPYLQSIWQGLDTPSASRLVLDADARPPPHRRASDERV